MGDKVPTFLISTVVIMYILCHIAMWLALIVGGCIIIFVIMMLWGYCSTKKKKKEDEKKYPAICITKENISEYANILPLEPEGEIKLVPYLTIKLNDLGMINQKGLWQPIFLKTTRICDNAKNVLLMDMMLQRMVKWQDIKSQNHYALRDDLKNIIVDINKEDINTLWGIEHFLGTHLRKMYYIIEKDRCIDMIESIRLKIDKRLPIMLSIEKNRKDMILLVVGYELGNNKKVKRLYCLTPSCKSPQNCYWNTYIDISENSSTEYRIMPENKEIKLNKILCVNFL